MILTDLERSAARLQSRETHEEPWQRHDLTCLEPGHSAEEVRHGVPLVR